MKYKLSLFLFLLSTIVLAQSSAAGRGNLSEYYKQRLHFGFAISLHKADFLMDPVADFAQFDTLQIVETVSHPGFNLGIVSEFAIHDYVTLRFLPNISFSDRTIKYQLSGKKETEYIKDIESTFLNFPLVLKLRSKRVQNFGAYVIAGGAYTWDLASKKKQDEELSPVLSEQTVKLKQQDISYEMGAGAEFYLMYFKFAIEGKLSIGTNNMLIKEDTIFANPINKLNSKMFIISITFEG